MSLSLYSFVGSAPRLSLSLTCSRFFVSLNAQGGGGCEFDLSFPLRSRFKKPFVPCCCESVAKPAADGLHVSIPSTTPPS